MSANELQQEELEVLRSIYDGDGAFKQISDTVFQYKFGDDGSYKSFIVEISWPVNYPEEIPVINMDLFYNKHVIQAVKDAVKSGLSHQAEELLGMSMTFSLFEWVKDNLESLLQEQPDAPSVLTLATAMDDDADDTPQKKEKKEQLTKSQKRRLFDRFGAGTDRPRGWDWVDIIKHLAQTGGKPDS
ncbi:RWD domain-containing protein 4 [Bulinus truncatus]|nr:RWD domain-containing protein 4 [Bulinus truncatus]